MIIKTISYDAANGAFQARVDLVRNGMTFRYPCTVYGPMNMDDATLRARVTQQAHKMSGLTL